MGTAVVSRCRVVQRHPWPPEEVARPKFLASSIEGTGLHRDQRIEVVVGVRLGGQEPGGQKRGNADGAVCFDPAILVVVDRPDPDIVFELVDTPIDGP